MNRQDNYWLKLSITNLIKITNNWSNDFLIWYDNLWLKLSILFFISYLTWFITIEAIIPFFLNLEW